MENRHTFSLFNLHIHIEGKTRSECRHQQGCAHLLHSAGLSDLDRSSNDFVTNTQWGMGFIRATGYSVNIGMTSTAAIESRTYLNIEIVLFGDFSPCTEILRVRGTVSGYGPHTSLLLGRLSDACNH